MVSTYVFTYLFILDHLREEEISLCILCVPGDSVVQTKADAKWRDDGLEWRESLVLLFSYPPNLPFLGSIFRGSGGGSSLLGFWSPCVWQCSRSLSCRLSADVLRFSESCPGGSDLERKSSYPCTHLHLLGLVGLNLWGNERNGLEKIIPPTACWVPLISCHPVTITQATVPGYTWRERCLGIG